MLGTSDGLGLREIASLRKEKHTLGVCFRVNTCVISVRLFSSSRSLNQI
jgi:hypothetical protein